MPLWKPEGTGHGGEAGRQPARPCPAATLAQISTLVSLVLALAVLAGAAIGLGETQRTDSRLAAEQHAALQATLDELHAVFGDADRFDAGQLSLIARRAGLHDLRFEADLAADRGREVQSLHDAQGRIVGWFSWTPDRAFIDTMDWLWGLLAAVGVVLAFCAYLRGALHATAWRLVGARHCQDTQAHHAGCADRASQPSHRAATSRRGGRGARLERGCLCADRHRRLSRHQRHAGSGRRRHHAVQHRGAAQIRRCPPAPRSAVSTTTNSQ